jgi:hypothetical protein
MGALQKVHSTKRREYAVQYSSDILHSPLLLALPLSLSLSLSLFLSLSVCLYLSLHLSLDLSPSNTNQ